MAARSGIMLCYPFEEKRLLKWKPPYIVQPKLDGVRCRAVRNNYNRYNLLSSEEKEITSMPHINRALDYLPQKPPELDGELYCHGLDFEEIFSRTSRTANIHSSFEEIGYYMFDQVDMEPQYSRLIQLISLKDCISPPLRLVPHVICTDLNSVLRAFDDFVESGYEGIVVRHIENLYIRRRSIYMMKFKPNKDDYYIIVGFKEEVSIHGEPKGRLGALECTSSIGEEIFSVGSGFTADQRSALWTDRFGLIGKLAHVKYQHLTSGKGVPRFPVFIEIIDAEPAEVGLRQ